MKGTLIIVLLFIINTIQCNNYDYTPEAEKRTLIKDVYSLIDHDS